jgi:hypothetical protein
MSQTQILTHLYEYTYAYPTPMGTFERLTRLDFEIREVDQRASRYRRRRRISVKE